MSNASKYYISYCSLSQGYYNTLFFGGLVKHVYRRELVDGINGFAVVVVVASSCACCWVMGSNPRTVVDEALYATLARSSYMVSACKYGWVDCFGILLWSGNTGVRLEKGLLVWRRGRFVCLWEAPWDQWRRHIWWRQHGFDPAVCCSTFCIYFMRWVHSYTRRNFNLTRFIFGTAVL